MNKINKQERLLFHDLLIITISIILAVVFVKTGILAKVLGLTKGLEFLESFIAGLFFTSVFTTAPAIVTLGEIARSNSLFFTAFSGAFGALLGDLIIFRFIKDRLGEHLLELIRHEKGWKRVKALVKLKYFRWFTFLAGGLLIASPLPDELGISLLGLSKAKMSVFISISFFFNFLGILIIGIIARAI